MLTAMAEDFNASAEDDDEDDDEDISEDDDEDISEDDNDEISEDDDDDISEDDDDPLSELLDCNLLQRGFPQKLSSMKTSITRTHRSLWQPSNTCPEHCGDMRPQYRRSSRFSQLRNALRPILFILSDIIAALFIVFSPLNELDPMDDISNPTTTLFIEEFTSSHGGVNVSLKSYISSSPLMLRRPESSSNA